MERTIAPPHPDPHPPIAFTPPPGSCDAHCHIFGPAARFPFAADRTYTPPDAGFEQFVRLQERLGLDSGSVRPGELSRHGQLGDGRRPRPWPRAVRRRGDARRLVQRIADRRAPRFRCARGRGSTSSPISAGRRRWSRSGPSSSASPRSAGIWSCTSMPSTCLATPTSSTACPSPSSSTTWPGWTLLPDSIKPRSPSCANSSGTSGHG